MASDMDPVPAMDFGIALELLKDGYHLAREGWNKSGQYVVFQAGYPDGVPIDPKSSTALKLPVGTVVLIRPYFLLHAADGSYVPWVPTVSDVLAEDWVMIVQDEPIED